MKPTRVGAYIVKSADGSPSPVTPRTSDRPLPVPTERDKAAARELMALKRGGEE